jgi:hypothetical protein
MAIVVVIQFPNDPIEKYEKAWESGGAPMLDQPKRLHHIAYRTGDVGFTVVDVWEDEAAFQAFGEIIGLAVDQAELEGRPTVYPLLGYVGADGIRNP